MVLMKDLKLCINAVILENQYVQPNITQNKKNISAESCHSDLMQ